MSGNDFTCSTVNDWCAGCGDFGILRALEKALAALDLPTHQVAVFGGIGCSGKTPYYLNCNGVHSLHGRVLPFASGAKLARPEMTVIAVGGDGDGLSIGAGHFASAGRRNLDITYLLFNNGVYGLTKGQGAPSLRQGEQTRAMPRETIMHQLNPIMLALTSGFTWIARGYSYDTHQLQTLIQQGIEHRGSAFIEILQPCPTYNDLHDKEWFSAEVSPGIKRLYCLQDEGYDPDVTSVSDPAGEQQKMSQCVIKSQEWAQRIPTGIFYRDTLRAEMIEALSKQQPAYHENSPSTESLCIKSSHRKIDWTALLREFEV